MAEEADRQLKEATRSQSHSWEEAKLESEARQTGSRTCMVNHFPSM